MDDELAARSLGALSQVHRLKAFRALVVAGKSGMTPGVLSDQLGISPASMSFQFKELLYAGLVSQTRDGRKECIDRMARRGTYRCSQAAAALDAGDKQQGSHCLTSNVSARRPEHGRA